MGKMKVSFTTVLFVFSFIICVIVAVVFVDRGPRNDYDSFYENADESTDRDNRDNNDERPDGGNQNRQQANAPASTSPPAAPTPDESSFADLPLDAHLKAAAQPVQLTPTPAPTANPMQGRSPEDIARSMMGQSGISPAQSASGVPQMAVPPGIATPSMQQGQMTQQTPQQTRSVLPLQSNDPTNSMGSGITRGDGGNAPGLYGLPSLGTGSSSNAEGGWSAVTAKQTPDRMLGVRSAPSDAQNGMMISRGATEAGADAPAGFEQSITSHTPATGVSAPGGFEEPMLLQAPGQTPNKWDLPAAPTLRPPPIQDPDRPRSDADPAATDLPTPGSMDLEGSSGQALAISDMEPEATDEATAEEPAHVAKVNNRTLTAEQAVKLAEVTHALKDDILTEDKRDEEAKKAAETWADIVASAEMAQANGIDVAVPEVEKYAGMRPDFDPAAWQAAMADKGFAPQDIRQLLRDMALSEKLVEMEFEQATDEDELRKAYEKKPSQYASPRKVRLLEIYKDKPDDDDRAEKVASSMRRLQRQAASGTDFGLLARQASQSDTRQKGGDLGWITPSESKDELRDKAIADLEPGQVSNVIDEPDGYRIYKLVEVKEAQNDFEGGRDLVVAELKKPIRTESLKEAREKLEAGEPLVLDRIVTAQAKAEAPQPDKPQTASADDKPSTDAEPPATDELSPEEAERRAIARQVLANARARRNGETPGQQANATPATPLSVPQQRGAANQLLYAPGTQVQQMGGGQPAPPYQAGGQNPAPPISSAMTAPNSVSVNGNVSVNYAPGQTMHVGQDFGGGAGIAENTAAGLNNPAAAYPNSDSSMEPAGDTAYIDLGYSQQDSDYLQDQPQVAQPQQGAAQLTQTPEVSQSNGWTVTKTVRRPSDGGNASSAVMPQDEAMPSDAGVPPGFESADSAASAPEEEEPENRRGIIGNVKSFFGGFRR